MSFVDIISAIKVRLEHNAALTSFCNAHFGNTQQVSKEFRIRTEVNAADLPLIMITRPSRRTVWAGTISKKENIVALLAIFQQDDKALALDQIIQMEELLETIMSTRTSLPGDHGFASELRDSANDEGLYYPVYAIRLEFVVRDR